MSLIHSHVSKVEDYQELEAASMLSNSTRTKSERDMLNEDKKGYINVVAGLCSRLKDPHPEIRTASASALGHFTIKTDEIVSALTQLIHDSDPEVISTVERSLFQLGVKEKDMVQAIERQQQLENEDFVLEVPIHSVKDKNVFQALTLLAGSCLFYRLDDVVLEIREMASRALRALGLRGPVLANTLMRHMRDPKLNTILSNVVAFHLVDEEILLQMFMYLARDRHKDIRAGCAFVLGTCPRLWAVADGLGYGEVISILLNLLEDQFEEVKRDALLALVNIAQKEDLASLVEDPEGESGYLSDRNDGHSSYDGASVNEYSPTMTNNEMGGLSPHMESSQRLQGVSSSILRSSAGNIRRIITAIQKILLTDEQNSEGNESNDVRYTAAISLAMLEIDDELVINALVGHLKREDNRNKRAEILEAIRRIGKKRSGQGHIHQGCNCSVMIAALKGCLAGTKRDLLVAACRGLLAFEVKEEEFTFMIMDVVLKASNTWDLRVECCQMLGQLGFANEKVIEFLLSCLSDADPSMRTSAINSLNSIYLVPRMSPISPDERVLSMILARLTDVSDKVRSAATKSCTVLNITERCVGELLKVVKDQRPSVRCAAVKTMGLLNGVRNSNPLNVSFV